MLEFCAIKQSYKQFSMYFKPVQLLHSGEFAMLASRSFSVMFTGSMQPSTSSPVDIWRAERAVRTYALTTSLWKEQRLGKSHYS